MKNSLKKEIVGSNFVSNLLLTFKVIFELSIQILVIYLISKMIENKITLRSSANIFISIFCSIVLKCILNYVHVKIVHYNAYSKLTEIRLKIINHFDKLNMGFFKNHSIGELVNIVQNDVEKIEVYLAHGLPEIMSATLIPLLIFIFMLFIDYYLAFAMILGLPFMFLIKVVFSKTMEKKLKGTSKN